MVTWTSKMYFGRYKGELICDIFDDNPNYLLWVSKNVTDIEFIPDILETLAEFESEQINQRIQHQESVGDINDHW